MIFVEEENGDIVVLSISNQQRNPGGLKPKHINVDHVRHPNQDQRFMVDRARYARSEDEFRVSCQQLLDRFQNQEFSPRQFRLKFSKEIGDFYDRMYLLGKTSVGGSIELTLEEKRWLHGQHSLDMRYFNNFLRDMSKGAGKMSYSHRMDLYALGGSSMYFRGAVYSSRTTDRWFWMLSPAEHCRDCLRNAQKSEMSGGFTRKQLLGKVGVPGQYVICHHRCRCGLQLRKGVSLSRIRPTSFKHVQRIMPQS